MVLFLLTELPQGILIILSVILRGFFQNVYIPMGDAMDMVALINSGINFVLYCSMSCEFRRTLVKMFTFTIRKKQKRTAVDSLQTQWIRLRWLPVDIRTCIDVWNTRLVIINGYIPWYVTVIQIRYTCIQFIKTIPNCLIYLHCIWRLTGEYNCNSKCFTQNCRQFTTHVQLSSCRIFSKIYCLCCVPSTTYDDEQRAHYFIHRTHMERKHNELLHELSRDLDMTVW